MSTPPPDPDDGDRTMMRRPRPAPRAAAAINVDAEHLRKLEAINPIITAANPLLMMVPTLRSASAPSDIPSLRARLIAKIQEFDNRCAQLQVPDDQRTIARYALCTVFDECAQQTPWGGTANWAQQSLLINFFSDNWGGEKFFQMLAKMMETPARYQSMLELFYVCLSLGFMGKYQLAETGGRQALADVRERLYQVIRSARGEPDKTLATQWRGLSVAGSGFRGFAVFGAVIATLLIGCLALYATLAFTLGGKVDAMELGKLALAKPAPTPAAVKPAAKPRLAQLLAPEIAEKKLDVRDLQFESIVTLPAKRLFDSGSATPSAETQPLLERVADALNQVEGRVIVTGHTDNVPTRTLRFASNWQLSQERAASVSTLIARKLAQPARVSSEGKGDTEPVAPNSDADNRALNRRVEIVLRSAEAGGR